MPTELLDLPAELQLIISHHLSAFNTEWRYDNIALSSTCSLFRSLLSPAIFRSLTLRNSELNARSVLAISKSSLRNHVEEIQIEAGPPGDELIDMRLDKLDYDRHTLSEMLKTNGLPYAETCVETWVAEYEQVLSTLGTSFPNLGQVTMEFGFGEEYFGWPPGSQLTRFDEDELRMVGSDMVEPWKHLLDGTYDLLALGCIAASSKVKSLHLHSIPPVETPALRTPHFRAFLGRLADFDMSLCGDEDNSGLHTTRQFPEKLWELFFDHLGHCTSFSLVGSVVAPLGLHYPLSFKPKMIPLLRNLFLQDLVIDNVLCNFLVAHSRTLETVDLFCCFADLTEFHESGITWDFLLTKVADSNPTNMKRFTIEDEEYEELVFYLNDEVDAAEGEDIRSQMKQVKRIIDDDKSRRLFRYTCIDLEGGVDDDLEDFCKAMLDGHDQIAYDRLMNLIGKNS